MPRLLVVSHRSLEQAGGATARWRSFARMLPEHGWEVSTVVAPARAGAVELDHRAWALRVAAARARVMAAAGRVAAPAFALAGTRPEALPLSMTWVPRGAAAVRAAVRERRPDVVLATGPPVVALLAARLGVGAAGPPLVHELRDLWAGSPAFDLGGPTLQRIEAWAFAPARRVVAVTPEAAADLRARHPGVADRVAEVPNGFEAELLGMRPPPREARRPLEILHTGTLQADRPLAPLLDVLADARYRDAFTLTLHGHLAPITRAELAAAAGRVDVRIVAPSSWEDSVRRIAAADAGLVTQAAGAGDATAVASKVYEYLALGRPVLCVSDGGATEALLRRLGAERALLARLEDPMSIAAALDRLLSAPPVDPLPPERLAPYRRDALAARMAALLDEVAS